MEKPNAIIAGVAAFLLKINNGDDPQAGISIIRARGRSVAQRGLVVERERPVHGIRTHGGFILS